MIIYAVDDEPLQLRLLTRSITEAVPDAELYSFTCANDLLTAADSGYRLPDVAFLDIELPDIGGLELAYYIKNRAPHANIVFVTGFSQYAQEAFSLRPSGYVMKPATAEKIKAELDNLRDPPRRTVPEKKIRVQCFGDFEIFADGAPVTFLRSKSKELLAYLVDRRGALCHPPAIAAVLWEDGIYDSARQKLLSIIRSDMIKSLKKAGADRIIHNERRGIAVVPAEFDCDYYMALAGDTVSINSFTNEYMTAYSWAEITAAFLSSSWSGKCK